jgi:hypothetical protein
LLLATNNEQRSFPTGDEKEAGVIPALPTQP